MKAKFITLATVVRYVAIWNFAVFVMLLLYLGGDALNGKVDAGHFYLGQHGKFVEVSALVFRYSYWHTVLSMVLIPLAMLVTLASKPDEAEQKWQKRIVTTFLVTSFAYAFFKYR